MTSPVVLPTTPDRPSAERGRGRPRPPGTSGRTRRDGLVGAGTAAALVWGFVVGVVGAVAHDVDVRVAGAAAPVGLVLVAAVAALSMLCAVAASPAPWPRFALAGGWVVAVGLAGSSGPGSDLLLLQDARGTVFLVLTALVMGGVALLAPRRLP